MRKRNRKQLEKFIFINKDNTILRNVNNKEDNKQNQVACKSYIM